MNKLKKTFGWKDVADILGARRAIDTGCLLMWSDAKQLVRKLDETTQAEVVRHITLRLSERWNDRLAAEILVDSLLVILVTASKESLLAAFLEEVINGRDFENVARVFVEISLTTEVTDDEREITARATSVALICELGFNIQHIEDEYPGQLERGRALLDHIATYLLSVGNTSIPAVRLSLLRYFSNSEYGAANKPGFNKIMGRFGHTMYDTLFQQLFFKKNEAIALQYLLENIPTALEAAGDSQAILHETFKQYMLKNPERFSLFMHEMGNRVLSLNPTEGQFCPAAESYYRHLIALFKVTSDLDHRSLGKEVFSEIVRLESIPGCTPYSAELQKSTQIRRSFRELITGYKKDILGKGRPMIVSQFRLSKRGRKPTLNKKTDVGFLEQVMQLGQWELQKSA